MSKTITLAPKWEGLSRWIIHALRDPKLPAEPRTAFTLELARLGTEVIDLLPTAVDNKAPERAKAEARIIAIAAEVDRRNAS